MKTSKSPDDLVIIRKLNYVRKGTFFPPRSAQYAIETESFDSNGERVYDVVNDINFATVMKRKEAEELIAGLNDKRVLFYWEYKQARYSIVKAPERLVKRYLDPDYQL